MFASDADVSSRPLCDAPAAITADLGTGMAAGSDRCIAFGTGLVDDWSAAPTHPLAPVQCIIAAAAAATTQPGDVRALSHYQDPEKENAETRSANTNQQPSMRPDD